MLQLDCRIGGVHSVMVWLADGCVIFCCFPHCLSSVVASCPLAQFALWPMVAAAVDLHCHFSARAWSLSIFFNAMKRKNEKEPPVPVKVAKSQAPASAQPHAWIDPGDSDPHSHSAEDEMKKLIPWLRNCLPDFLTQVAGLAVTSLAAVPPLQIQGPGEAGPICNFKEIWNPANAVRSINSTGMYEAGGNLTWLDPSLSGVPEVARSEPAWALVIQYASQYFSPAVAIPDASGQKGLGRIVFPFSPIEAYVKDIDHMFTGGASEKGKTMPEKLVLLTGHAMLYAWWLATARAVRAKDSGHVKLLWECALTCTIRASVHTNLGELNIRSIQAAENFTAFQDMCDTFWVWARKVKIVEHAEKLTGSAQKLAAELAQRGIRYNGAPVSKGMVLAAQSLLSMASRGVSRVVTEMDHEFGREFLSTSYNKLSRLATLVKTHAPGVGIAESPEVLLEFVLGMMLLTLRTREVTPKFFTIEVLDKGKDGSAGWVGMSCAKYATIKHLLHILACLPDDDAMKEAKSEVSRSFENPDAFMKAFGIELTQDADAEEQVCKKNNPDVLASMCESLNKTNAALFDLVHSVYIGDFDAEMKALGGAKSATERVRADELAESCPDLAARMREVLRMASSAGTIVQVSDGAPGLSVRQLARIASDPGSGDVESMQQERDAVWAKARAQRQKFIQFAQCKTKILSKAGAEAALAQAASVARFKGKLNEAHRLYVVSADLLGEADKIPWKAPAFKDKSLEGALAYMKDRAGDFDFVIGFDGRHRGARGILEANLTAGAKSVEEVWIVYGAEQDTSRSRKTCLSSNNKEVGYVRIPGNRAKLMTRPREEFAGSGERTTHSSTFTDVPLPNMRSMPKIAAVDKQKIAMFESMDVANPAPEGWDCSGVPLFWRESKSISFWRCLLVCFDIKAVVDLSPGSGTLASAAMAEGIQYVGVVCDATHSRWLQNTCDRASLQYIVKNGTALYQQDLAELVQQHYKDVLEELGDEAVEEDEKDATVGADVEEEADDDQELADGL